MAHTHTHTNPTQHPFWHRLHQPASTSPKTTAATATWLYVFFLLGRPMGLACLLSVCTSTPQTSRCGRSRVLDACESAVGGHAVANSLPIRSLKFLLGPATLAACRVACMSGRFSSEQEDEEVKETENTKKSRRRRRRRRKERRSDGEDYKDKLVPWYRFRSTRTALFPCHCRYYSVLLPQLLSHAQCTTRPAAFTRRSNRQAWEVCWLPTSQVCTGRPLSSTPPSLAPADPAQPNGNHPAHWKWTHQLYERSVRPPPATCNPSPS